MTNNLHESVMVDEVIREMVPVPVERGRGKKIIDCTLGTGGHAEALIKKGCEVLGIEADPKMLEIAKARLGPSLRDEVNNFVLGNFSNLDKIAKENNFDKVDGILFDLGVSNLHLKDDDRGFSFTESEQNLDMRLNPDVQGVCASDLLNALNIGQLILLFSKVMNFGLSRRWAQAVISNRPFKTVGDLKHIAYGIPHKASIDSATLPMLALRIAVNSEFENLEEALPKAFDLLKPNGKLLVITFHSGEIKILERNVTQKGYLIYPTEAEISKNPRSRSAKLYVYKKN